MISLDHWTLCFHRGGGGTPAQNAMSAWIRLWTRSLYSHVELYDPACGYCWSASGYEGKVRFKKIVFSHPERWDFLALPDEIVPPDIRDTEHALNGLPYDYRGACACGTPWAKTVEDPHKWYCFESNSRALRWAPYQKTGRSLYACAIKLGWKL